MMDDAPQPRGSLGRLLPLILIALLLMGQAAFFVAFVLPKLQAYTDANAQVTALQAQIDSLTTPESDIEVYQLLIESAQADRAESAAFLLSVPQSEAMLDKLYQYAIYSNVTVTNLQAQQPTVPSTNTFETVSFRIRVEGLALDLIHFLVRIREASARSMALSGVTLAPSEDAFALIADLTIYSSTFADGRILDSLPEFSLPAFAESNPTTGQPTVPATVDATTPPTDSAQGGTLLETPSPLPENPMASACPGAPVTLFTVGNVAVVDFRSSTKLNVLTAPRGASDAVDVITRVGDGARLTILEGPVCGMWNNAPLWYWFVDYGGVTGWVGEGTSTRRWLCPESNPRCS